MAETPDAVLLDMETRADRPIPDERDLCLDEQMGWFAVIGELQPIHDL